MTISTDSARRPLYVDRRSGRFFADPLIGGGAWPEVSVSLAQLGTLPANPLLGRQGTSGTAGTLSADVTIDLLNTATTQTLNAARVVAASTTGAGVVQLFDGTGSTSTALAATANSVRLANDLAGAALARTGGTMTGAITFAAGRCPDVHCRPAGHGFSFGCRQRHGDLGFCQCQPFFDGLSGWGHRGAG